MPPRVTRLAAELDAVTEYWFPRIVARVNDHYVKVARLRGELAWHAHAEEDELFLVLKGRLRLQFEDGEVELGEGELCVVPKGTRHNPVADEECWVALVEPVGTRHTGDEETPLTRTIEEQFGTRAPADRGRDDVPVPEGSASAERATRSSESVATHPRPGPARPEAAGDG